MTVVARRVYPVDAPRADEDQPSSGAYPTTRFALAIGRVGGAVVVTLHGELAGPAVTQLEDVLEDLVCGQGNLTVVVDLRELSGVDPTARAVLAVAADWARRRGGTFRLQVPSPPGS